MDNADLRLIVFNSIKSFGEKVDLELQNLNNTSESYIVKIKEDVFSSGESKVTLLDSIRGKDLYIFQDVCNYSKTYKMRGLTNHFSPNDYFKQIKDVVGAINGHAKRITVVMPYLIDGRQHRRNSREPLSCAMDLQELKSIGVDSLVSLSLHSGGVKNALPLNSFENIFPTNTILKSFVINENKNVDFSNLIIISPDLGASDKAKYYAEMLNVKYGIFEKNRDYSKVIDGKNKIISHDYLGPDLSGKDIFVVDDMISSGESMIDVAREAKRRGANKIYVAVSFALFTGGMKEFDECYKEGIFEKIYTTNTTYIDPSIANRPYIEIVDCSCLFARIINRMNKNKELSSVLSEKENVMQYIYK